MREAPTRRSPRCARSRPPPTTSGPWSPSPTRAAGARADRATPVGQAAEELGIPALRPATINDPRSSTASGGGRRGPRRRGVRPDPARRRPVPLAVRERPLLAAARLPRGRAGGAGDHGRRHRDGRDDHVHGGGPRHRARFSRSSAPPWARTRRAGRCWPACPSSAARCSCGPSTTWRPGVSTRARSPTRASRSPPRSSRRTVCSTSTHPAAQLARRVRALAPHRRDLPHRRRALQGVARAGRVEPVPPGLVGRRGAAARPHRRRDASRSPSSSRRAAAGWTPARSCAAGAARSPGARA